MADEHTGGRGAEPQIVPNVPAETNVFSTTQLIEGIRIRYPVPSFIRDMFFSARDYVNSDVVQVDTYKGGRGLAPFVLPLEGQVVGRRLPFGRTFVEAPIIAPARVITLREAGRPGWMETPYNWKSPEERVASLIAQDTQDMDDEISRTEEYMCCQCILGGTIPINYRNKTSVQINYGFSNTTALAKPWTDPTADPLGDLRAAQSGLNANGYGGNVAVYSPQAWNALMNNPNVKDTLKVTLPSLAPMTHTGLPEMTPAGVAKGPDFNNPIMQNWIYSGTYVKSSGAAPAGTAIPYIPRGSVIVGSSDVKNRIIYAMVTQIEQSDGNFHSYLLDRVPKYDVNVLKNHHMLTITSRPVPVPVDLLCWTVLTGVVP
jgi:Phage major capsid protein E